MYPVRMASIRAKNTKQKQRKTCEGDIGENKISYITVRMEVSVTTLEVSREFFLQNIN